MPTLTLPTLTLAAWLAALPALTLQPATEPPAQPAAPRPSESEPATPADQPAGAPHARFADARELLKALGERDKTIEILTGQVRLTAIQALQGDTQRRYGKLALKTVRTESGQPRRLYAVRFERLEIDQRVQTLNEQYIFDGRWLVERLPDERQFIKHEIVPVGQTLDPMDLMRDAPFWVTVGDDPDRVLRDYDAELLPPDDGLTGNDDLKGLTVLVEGCVQLKLTPKPDGPAADDWDSVRLWFNPATLLPVLYLKTEWTGDLQIAELFEVSTDSEVPDSVFDTTAPPDGAGWQVQIAPWRGRADD